MGALYDRKLSVARGLCPIKSTSLWVIAYKLKNNEFLIYAPILQPTPVSFPINCTFNPDDNTQLNITGYARIIIPPGCVLTINTTQQVPRIWSDICISSEIPNVAFDIGLPEETILSTPVATNGSLYQTWQKYYNLPTNVDDIRPHLYTKLRETSNKKWQMPMSFTTLRLVMLVRALSLGSCCLMGRRKNVANRDDLNSSLINITISGSNQNIPESPAPSRPPTPMWLRDPEDFETSASACSGGFHTKGFKPAPAQDMDSSTP